LEEDKMHQAGPIAVLTGIIIGWTYLYSHLTGKHGWKTNWWNEYNLLCLLNQRSHLIGRSGIWISPAELRGGIIFTVTVFQLLGLPLRWSLQLHQWRMFRQLSC